MSNFYNNQMSEKKANSVGKGKKTNVSINTLPTKKAAQNDIQIL